MIAALWFLPHAVVAQDLTLTARDGGLQISGSLQGYDGEFYRVLTPYGMLTVDGAGVTCDGPACPDLTSYVAEVRLTGEAAHGVGLLGGLLAGFAAERGLTLRSEADVFELADGTGRVQARFSFSPLPADAAAEALRLGAADIAFSDVTEPDLRSRVLGRDYLVAVVSPQNPVGQMSTGDLVRALTGKIESWAELGGPDMPVAVHTLAGEAGLRRALEKRIGAPMVVAREHGSLSALAEDVARDPWGLALTLGSAAGAARVLVLTDSCGFALQPTEASVKSGDYPLGQPAYLLLPKRRLPLVAREFLEFLDRPESDAAIAAGGLIDREVERVGLIGDGVRLANAIRAAGPEVGVEELQRLTATMAGAERLSLTFRFEGGATVLDAASRDNLAVLIRLIESGVFADEELVFVGFSDGSGSAAANLDLSRQRADILVQTVAEAVPDLGDMRVRLAADAFGETLPMACDESPAGSQINRRVEVWVRPARGSPPPEN